MAKRTGPELQNDINIDSLNQDVEVDETQAEATKFKIDNLKTASWAMRKINTYKKHQEQIDALAENEIQRIKSWQEKEKAISQRSIDFFVSHLTVYLYEQRAINPKFKLSTPYGTVGTKKQPFKWEIKDQDTLIAWLKENGQATLINTKEKPYLEQLKKTFKKVGNHAIDEDGQIVPGIFIVEQQEKVIIKTNE